LKPLPKAVRTSVEALVGCIAGAVLVKETRRMARAAGLVSLKLTSKQEYIEAMTDGSDPLYRRVVRRLPAGARVSDYVTSLYVEARKAD